MLNSGKICTFLKFLGDVLGDDAEIIVSNVEKMEIAFIYNSSDYKQIGDGLPEIEKNIIERKLFEEKDFIINYRAFSSSKEKLRSSSYFVKKHSGELTNIITINYKVDKLIEFRHTLNQLINGTSNENREEEQFQESFNHSFADLMEETIQSTISQFGVSPERLSHTEKLELVQLLDQKGVFLLKGSIPELAKILCTSETSIYRYINDVNKI
ncbi:MAG TPA: helix-turn-helix domain-containing protein [Pseudogracilibacillus sp.]|nr:helix-turn-helix domain-containing protein [Pseudogracilibacillus sp.]